jgi:hypothetical protein
LAGSVRLGVKLSHPKRTNREIAICSRTSNQLLRTDFELAGRLLKESRMKNKERNGRGAELSRVALRFEVFKNKAQEPEVAPPQQYPK